MAEMDNHVEVAVGTYEEMILGYRLSLDDDKPQLVQSFTNHSHTGCIKKLAMSQNGILASGGTDETIWLFNLRKRTEIGSLVQHSGTITWLDFFKSSHLFSTSEDGKLCMWRAFTWECLRTFKGHKAAVNCVAVHPSGKMALTVGKDRALHTWNLVKGRSAYVTNIKQVADMVQWSPDGTCYLIVFNNKIDFYKVETAAVFHTLNSDRRVNAVVFLRSNMVAYGGEGGDVIFYNCKEGKEMHRIHTNTVRIRDLVKVKTTSDDHPLLLLSASSDGHINVYKVVFVQDGLSASLVTSHNSKFRLTCITAAEIKTKTKSSVDFKTEIKQEPDSGEEVKYEKVDEYDSDIEIKDEKEEDSLEIKEEVKEEDSDSSEPRGRKKKLEAEKGTEADSGHVDEDSSNSESSDDTRWSRKRSFLEFKRSQKLKRKMKEEQEETKKKKKEQIKGKKKSKKASPRVKKGT